MRETRQRVPKMQYVYWMCVLDVRISFLAYGILAYLPLDILKSWRGEKGQREIHRPIEDRR